MAHDLDDHIIVFPAPAPAPALPPPPTLRLSLTTGPHGHGALDGGWWPRSRDAAIELPELFKGLRIPEATGVVRLDLDLNDWDRVPRRIIVGRHLLKVGWLPHLDHIIIVSCARRHELVLLVIPPGAADDAAESALIMAGAGTDGVSPQQILADCDISPVRANSAQRADRPTSPPEGTGGRPHLFAVGSGTTWQAAVHDARLVEEPTETGRWLNDGAPVRPTD